MLIGFCANNFGTVMAILEANILMSSLSDFSNEYGMRFHQISREKNLRKILDYFFDSNFCKFVLFTILERSILFQILQLLKQQLVSKNAMFIN